MSTWRSPRARPSRTPGDHRPAGGTALSAVDPEVVRSALERAVEIARQQESATPSVAVPKELRPILAFRQLPTTALGPVLRLLDTDPGFRARVAEATTPVEIDAAGWLALTRPAGWEELVGQLAAKQHEDDSSEAAERRLRELQRKLATAEGKRSHAEAEAERRATEAQELIDELATVRRARREADDALGAAERRLDEMQQRLDERESRLAEAQGAREARDHELDEARLKIADLIAELGGRPPKPVPGERPVDVARLREAATRLDRSADALARSVEAVLAEVPETPLTVESPPEAERTAHRVPLALPGGVVADSVKGGRWLFGRPGVVALVDGYNVAKLAWPTLDLEDQRGRLVRALDELAMRTGAAVEIVFDGPANPDPASRPGTRSVGVRFSGGVEADDVVVDLVDAYPLDAPVVVVSNDNQVKTDARQRGANVLGSDTVIKLFSA